jgi:hypothetical protein
MSRKIVVTSNNPEKNQCILWKICKRMSCLSRISMLNKNIWKCHIAGKILSVSKRIDKCIFWHHIKWFLSCVWYTAQVRKILIFSSKHRVTRVIQTYKVMIQGQLSEFWLYGKLWQRKQLMQQWHIYTIYYILKLNIKL